MTRALMVTESNCRAVRGAPRYVEGPADPHELRFRKTLKPEVEAQIELGKLLELARAGRQPDSDLTVAELLDEYLPIAG